MMPVAVCAAHATARPFRAALKQRSCRKAALVDQLADHRPRHPHRVSHGEAQTAFKSKVVRKIAVLCSNACGRTSTSKSACIVAAAEPLNGTTLVPDHKHTLQLDSSTDTEEADEDMQAPHQPALLVFSGGTAFNSVAGDRCCHCPNKAQAMHLAVAMNRHNAPQMTVRCLIAGSLRNFTTRVAHVLPVSDDGGSTAEIVRVLGGPAVGDIRSRCLRLADDSNTEVTVASPCKIVLCTIHKRICPECLRLAQRSSGLAS